MVARYRYCTVQYASYRSTPLSQRQTAVCQSWILVYLPFPTHRYGADGWLGLLKRT
jgi:hypothetical protein